MKKHAVIVLIIFFCMATISCSSSNVESQLEYNYDLSNHEEVYVDDGYVVTKETIAIMNNTSDRLEFYMRANYEGDKHQVVAYQKDTMKEQQFHIGAYSKESFVVYFKRVKKRRKIFSKEIVCLLLLLNL